MHTPTFLISYHVTYCSVFVTKHKHETCRQRRRLIITFKENQYKQQRKERVSGRTSDSKITRNDSSIKIVPLKTHMNL